MDWEFSPFIILTIIDTINFRPNRAILCKLIRLYYLGRGFEKVCLSNYYCYYYCHIFAIMELIDFGIEHYCVRIHIIVMS